MAKTKRTEPTQKHKNFCYFYLQTGNITEAAQLAGFELHSGYRLLAEPMIQEYLNYLRAKIDDSRFVKAKENIYLLSLVARGEMKEDTVVTVGLGNGKSEAIHVMKQISIKDRIKALELLGKINGIFEEKLQITSNVPIIIQNEAQLSE